MAAAIAGSTQTSAIDADFGCSLGFVGSEYFLDIVGPGCSLGVVGFVCFLGVVVAEQTVDWLGPVRAVLDVFHARLKPAAAEYVAVAAGQIVPPVESDSAGLSVVAVAIAPVAMPASDADMGED